MGEPGRSYSGVNESGYKLLAERVRPYLPVINK